MATDWAADVKKYVADADDAAIAGIVRYCGIALRNRDSQLVAFSDKTETDRVRNNFLKKKLGLTQADATLDKAIAKVGEVMKADRTKNRVTVYYLLAAEFKKLGLFVKKAAAAKAPAAKADAKAPAKKAAPKSAAKAAGAAAAVAGAAAATTAAAKKAPAKAAAAPKKAAATAKPVAAAKKVAAPKKAAAPKKVATLKATPAKTKGLVDKAADAASDAGKTSAAAVAGTVAAVGAVGAAAVAAASGAAEAAKDTAARAAGAAGDAAGAAAGAVTGAAGAAAGAVTGAASVAADKAGALFSGGGQASTSGDEDSGLGWLWWLLGLALIALLIWWVMSNRADGNAASAGAPTEAVGDAGTAASGAPADLSTAPAEGSEAIPAGAGVTSELRDGKPVVKVYFDTAKTDVAPAFGAAAGGLKAWLDGHAGSKLAISGYSDPSGNAAANAELSKQRAQAVQAALVGAGIPVETAELVKPADSADASVPKEAARRVEVTVQ